MLNRASIVAALGGIAPLAAGQFVFWANPVDGVWNTPGSWSPVGVPGVSATATLGFSTPYTVTSTAGFSVASLVIANPLAVLAIEDGTNHTVAGNIVNLGSIVINGDGDSTDAWLRVRAATVNGPGSIRLVAGGSSADAALIGEPSGGGTLPTIAANAGVRGSGEVSGGWNVAGTLIGDDPAWPLELFDTINLSPGGVVTNDGSGRTVINGTVQDGTITTTGAGAIELSPAGLLLRVTNAGLLRPTADSSLLTDVVNQGVIEYATGTAHEISGSFANTGTVLINADGDGTDAWLTVRSGTTVTGPGEIRLVSGGSVTDAVLIGELVVGGPRPTIGAGTVVTGAGEFSGVWSVGGTIIADDPAVPLNLFGTIDLSPGGVVTDDGSGWILIGATVQDGTITTTGNGVLRLTSAGRLLRVTNAGLLRMFSTSSLLTDVVNEGVIEYDSGTAHEITGGLVNAGTVLINANGDSTDAWVRVRSATIDGPGEIRLVSGGSPSDAALIGEVAAGGSRSVIGATAIVTGTGEITGEWDVAGTLSPGASANTPGLLIGEEITLTPSAALDIEIGGNNPADFDRLAASTIDLDGALALSVINNYNASIGDSFSIIAAASGISGGFASVGFPPAPASGVWRLDARSDELRVVVTCAADLSSGGLPGSPDFILSGADFFEFLALFQAGDLDVDFSSPAQPGVPDGLLSGADFLFYLNLFSAGCN